MSSFAQTVSGDLDISTGNLVVRTDTGQLTAWKLSNLFSFFKGEWFMDVRLGIPYVQYVFVNNPNLTRIRDLFSRVIKSAPGVAAIASMVLDYNPRSRTLAATFQAITVTGEVLVGGAGKPFIIDLQRPA